MQKILFILALLLVSSLATSTHALTISPAKIEVTADPGSTVRGEIELFNEQEEAKIFYTSHENFESRGDSGAPYFTGAESGLATWISIISDVTLAPDERLSIPYTISIPASAKPGGYFAAIFFGSQPPRASDGEVSIGGKIGALILLKVTGDVEESAGLVDFGTVDGKRFFSTLPVGLEYGFNNTGGDRVVPRGEITIKNTLRLTSAKMPANEYEGSVLPNSTRRFETAWGNESKENLGFFGTALVQVKDFHIGWYTARLEVGWGQLAETASASYSFLVIPWQLLSIVIVIVFLAWFIFKFWFVRMKQKIIAEAMRNTQ